MSEPSTLMMVRRVSACFIFLSLTTQCGFLQPEHEVPRELTVKIRSLCEQYPPPSELRVLSEPKMISKFDRGTYGGWYASTMRASNVVESYKKRLLPDGWVFNDREISNILGENNKTFARFEKNGFFITVEFTDDVGKAPSDETEYGISCGFTP